MAADSREHKLYRIFGPKDALLYIGITVDYEARMRQHAEKGWWRLVRRIDTETFPNRAKAEAAEARAIREELPRFNRTHNPSAQPSPTPAFGSGRKWLSINDAAELVGCSPKTIRRALINGAIKGYRVPGSKLIRLDAIEFEMAFTPAFDLPWWIENPNAKEMF